MRRKRWNRHDIKAEVVRRKASLTRVALLAGLEPSACRVALCRRNIRGEQALADFLGVSVRVLWPERYPVTTSTDQCTRSDGTHASQKASEPADMGMAA